MTSNREIDLHESWLEHLRPEFDQAYMQQLRAFLAQEKRNGKVIYPPGAHIFNAFNSSPFDQVKVVILGQDPYHGPGQAHGLSFSVPEGVPQPPSLKNIYKAIEMQLGVKAPASGCLQHWALQGVLLLNATLTVEQNRAGSHQNKGWELFTDRAISLLSDKREHLVFMLWGSFARKKKQLIDTGRHCVLESAHPSPLSAHRGFFTNNHFTLANEYLKAHQKEPIDWI